MPKYISLVVIAVGLVFAGFHDPAFSHVSGQSWEVVLKEYKIDVGYDPAPFVSGQPVRLDFNVTKEATSEQVDFADVWVRITEGEKTVFASGIHRPSIGRAGMTFTFPEAGDYILSTRFEKDGTTIAETTFPVTVQQAEAASVRNNRLDFVRWAGWGVAVVALGGLVATVMINRKKKQIHDS